MTGSYSINSFDFEHSITDLPDDTVVGIKIGSLKYNLLNLMWMIGQRGFSVMVRFDPLRNENNFTVTIGNNRIGDTDDPTALLKQFVESEEE